MRSKGAVLPRTEPERRNLDHRSVECGSQSIGLDRGRIDLAQMVRCKLLLAILSASGGIRRSLGRRLLGALLNRRAVTIAVANSLSRLGCQMKNGLTVVNDGRRVSRRARTPSPREVGRLSNRIAVLEHILSVLRAELQIAGPNDRSKIGPRRVALCVRRPIAARYQTPTKSGSRRASSRP